MSANSRRRRRRPPGLPDDFYALPLAERVERLEKLFLRREPVTVRQVQCANNLLHAAMRDKRLGLPADNPEHTAAKGLLLKAAQTAYLVKRQYWLQRGEAQHERWVGRPAPESGRGWCVALANRYANHVFRRVAMTWVMGDPRVTIDDVRERRREFVEAVLVEYRHREHQARRVAAEVAV